MNQTENSAVSISVVISQHFNANFVFDKLSKKKKITTTKIILDICPLYGLIQQLIYFFFTKTIILIVLGNTFFLE